MGEKRTTFSSAQRPNEKWHARRAHMKIRDDANPINIRRIGVSTAFTRIPLLIPLPFFRPLFTVPAWCPMNHRLKRRVRQHSPKSFFTSLDWYKRDLTTTCRKLEENGRKAKKGWRRANHPLSSFRFYALLFFPFQSTMHPPARLQYRFISHFCFTFLPLCYLTCFYFLFPFWSLFISILPCAFVIFVYLEFIYLILFSYYVLFTIFTLLN